MAVNYEINMIEGHYSTKYDVELAELGAQTLEMGRLIQSQLEHATNALVRGDQMLAQLVADNEVLVNRLEVEIDKKSTELLARRQPAAGDLRFIVMIVKTVNDFERMGDEITRVALMGSRATQDSDNIPVYEDLEVLCTRVLSLLNKTLEAFEATDDNASLALIRKDKKVDKKFRNTLKKMIKWMMADPESAPEAVDILWAIRSLERVADRTCNICEHIIYFVKGEDIRHLDIDEIDSNDSASES